MRHWLKSISIILIVLGVSVLGLFQRSSQNSLFNAKGDFAKIASSGVFFNLGLVMIFIALILIMLLYFSKRR